MQRHNNKTTTNAVPEAGLDSWLEVLLTSLIEEREKTASVGKKRTRSLKSKTTSALVWTPNYPSHCGAGQLRTCRDEFRVKVRRRLKKASLCFVFMFCFVLFENRKASLGTGRLAIRPLEPSGPKPAVSLVTGVFGNWVSCHCHDRERNVSPGGSVAGGYVFSVILIQKLFFYLFIFF